ncbi:MAG: hypothetical protein O7G32_04415, partial [SAR324 cluster bacterium]|nr:hypothetical protein [SAR324 cluster bacterium]
MQPQTKASELIKRINAFEKSRERDVFTRTAIFRDIETLQKADPAIATACRGLMAAIAQDEQECRKQFEIARRLLPHDWWIESSNAKALHNLGYISEARAIARAIYDANSSDLDVL